MVSDFYDFYYCVRDLKELGLKVDFNEDSYFRILRRKDDHPITSVNSIGQLKAFINGLRIYEFVKEEC